jgi:hypothetical protein
MKIAVPLADVERLTFLLLLKYIMAQLLQIKGSVSGRLWDGHPASCYRVAQKLARISANGHMRLGILWAAPCVSTLAYKFRYMHFHLLLIKPLENGW